MFLNVAFTKKFSQETNMKQECTPYSNTTILKKHKAMAQEI